MEGTFVIDGPAGLLDAYSVRIEFGESFPEMPPSVFETAGRLPWEIDRHIFSDGHACLEVWPIWCAKNSNRSARAVLNGPVRNFFLSQSVFEAEGHWPFGDYSHGDVGRREALQEVLRAPSTDDKDLIWRVLALVKPPSRQNVCPCQSGKLYRKCHREELRELVLALSPEAVDLITTTYLGIWERDRAAAEAAKTEPSRE